MSRDGTGTYTLAATMAVSGAVASSTTVNSIMNDIAQALTDSINKDGTKAFAGNQSMGSNRLTTLADAVNATDAVTMKQLQTRAAAKATTVGGTVDAITLTFSPVFTAYTTGMVIRWISGGKNTVTTPTINIDSLGAKTLKRNPGVIALAVGDLGASGTVNTAMYDGTYFVLTGQNSAVASVDDFRAGTSDRILSTDTVFDAAAEVTLTPASTVSIDMDTFINAKITLDQNVTFGQPSNTKIGQSGAIRIYQDATGSRTALWHADWKWAGGYDPVLSTAANTIDIVFYQVIANNFIYASLIRAVA